MAFSSTNEPLYLGSGDYTAREDRIMTLFNYTEGVLPGVISGVPGDPRQALEVTPNTGGANWQVRIRTGWAVIQGDDATNQGMYMDYNSADLLITNASQAPASVPRVDIVIVQINDSEHTARTPANIFNAHFLYGTPTSGASLANRLGAPSIPPSALHLADVLVSPGNTSIQAAQIGDKRRISGLGIYGEDGKRYRLGIDADGELGLEALN